MYAILGMEFRWFLSLTGDCEIAEIGSARARVKVNPIVSRLVTYIMRIGIESQECGVMPLSVVEIDHRQFCFPFGNVEFEN